MCGKGAEITGCSMGFAEDGPQGIICRARTPNAGCESDTGDNRGRQIQRTEGWRVLEVSPS